jgi:ankyrin repeat protein
VPDGDITDMQKNIANENLVEAAQTDDREKIDLCLRKGADINARWRSYYNRTPLMIAVMYSRADLTAFILSKNPDLFLKDSEGKTVFDICNELSDNSKKRAINKLLLEAMPDAGNAPASAPLAETKDDIAIMKPIELGSRRKPGPSFNL